jgi:hypothetical protein
MTAQEALQQTSDKEYDEIMKEIKSNVGIPVFAIDWIKNITELTKKRLTDDGYILTHKVGTNGFRSYSYIRISWNIMQKEEI